MGENLFPMILMIFFRDTGTNSELTVPYNPQQNGVVERKNKTICQETKAMMCVFDLPYSIWEKASRKTIYIQKRIPHVVTEDKTPKEAFTSEKPEVGHLRIFGCLMYIHVPK